MSDLFTPLLRRYGHHLLGRVGELGSDASEPRERLLPIVAALLNGRQALQHGAVGSAVDHFVNAGSHLALLAFQQGPLETRVLDFVREQRRRLTDAHEAGRTDWLSLPPPHHFDRALANNTSVAYLVDPVVHDEPDLGRLRAQSADVANYLLFFLHTSGIELPAVESTREELSTC